MHNRFTLYLSSVNVKKNQSRSDRLYTLVLEGAPVININGGIVQWSYFAQIDLDSALFYFFCQTHHLFHDSPDPCSLKWRKKFSSSSSVRI